MTITKDLESLVEKYPEAFLSKKEDRFPTNFFLFECGNGWYDILDVPIASIASFNKLVKKDDKIIITQIKEKFGTLRFYTLNCPKLIEDIIYEAERKSHTTCEKCGEPSEVYKKNSWIYNHCNNCRDIK